MATPPKASTKAAAPKAAKATAPKTAAKPAAKPAAAPKPKITAKSIEFDQLSLEELREIRKQADKAIEGFEARQKQQALADMEEAARKHGFSLAQLTGGKIGKKNQPVSAPKYRNPSDATQTWTGRGRKPKWIDEAVKAGNTLESMLIS